VKALERLGFIFGQSRGNDRTGIAERIALTLRSIAPWDGFLVNLHLAS
jgi:hypothetical protein